MYNPVWRPIGGSGQNLAVGSAVVKSAAVGSQTRAVRLSGNANCHVLIADSSASVPSSGSLQLETLIKATDIPEILSCQPGSVLYVVQDGSSTGTLNLEELTH